MMTIDDVCEFLQLSRTTVYKLARSKEIPGRKVGGKWRFSREAIEAWALEDGTWANTIAE